MRQKHEIKFGTDGWRGIIGDSYNFENLKILSQAVSDYVGANKAVAVGYDTRFMSERFAEFVSGILKSNGIRVRLSDRAIPTPALSFTVKHAKLDLGIMITASHNPPEYNGLKIKVRSGGAAPLEITKQIENLIGRPAQKRAARNYPEVIKKDLTRDYIKFIRSYISLGKIRHKKFKVLIDVMYGSGDSFIADVLRGTDIKLEFMHHSINPSFGGIRPEPIEENLQELRSRVKLEKFDLGIALDGDADRIAAVAGGGVFLHPQKILGLLALHLNQDRHWSGGIVKTLCGTTMMDNIARFLKVKLYETPVGFKYISNLMETENILVGGEEAGGVGFKGYIPERDGMVAGLLLIEMMAYRNKNILQLYNEMEKQFGRYYYLRRDMRLSKRVRLKKENLPKRLLGKKVIQLKDYDGVKLVCEDTSWLMFRGSGTEPIIRIYAESKSLKKSKALIEVGASLANDL